MVGNWNYQRFGKLRQSERTCKDHLKALRQATTHRFHKRKEKVTCHFGMGSTLLKLHLATLTCLRKINNYLVKEIIQTYLVEKLLPDKIV